MIKFRVNLKAEEHIKRTEKLLTSMGFYVSKRVERSCFDFFGRRDNELIAIKVLYHVDTFKRKFADDLVIIQKSINAVPIIAGIKNSFGALKDGVVYGRYGIPTVSGATLEQYLTENIRPKMSTSKCGYSARIDKDKLRKMRKEKNMSLGALGRAVGVTAKTIASYERYGKASYTCARRIEKYLNTNIILGKDLFAQVEKKIETKEVKRESEPNVKNAIMQSFNPTDTSTTIKNDLINSLIKLQYQIYPTYTCPFDGFAHMNDKPIIFSIETGGRRAVKNAKIMSNISKVIEKPCVLFFDTIKADRDKGNVNWLKKKGNVYGIPVITSSELRDIKEPEEILRLIEERGNENWNSHKMG
ncbi:MAG: helix-turn-helix domain-containing protein [Candidatus Thermoplasmatota archaeon]